MNNTHRFLKISLLIFQEVATGKEKITIQSLVDRHGLSYASCYRIIHTFLEMGWLEENNGVFQACPALMIKIDSKREEEFLINTMKDSLQELVKQTELTLKMTIRRFNHAVSFFTLISPRPNSIFTKLSSRFHLAVGSSGSCLLSDLPDSEIHKILKTADSYCWKYQNEMDVMQRIECVRKHGYAIDCGTTNPNYHAISAPLFWPDDRVAATVTLLGFPSDLDTFNLKAIKSRLTEVQKTFTERVSCSSDLLSAVS